MAKRRVQKEKLKRKNYEIQTLKGELGVKDRDLQNSRRKLLSMEGSLVSVDLDVNGSVWKVLGFDTYGSLNVAHKQIKMLDVFKFSHIHFCFKILCTGNCDRM